MSAWPTLVIMAKRPKLSQGKQRLARDIGAISALITAEALLDCAIEDAASWPGLVVLAVAHQGDIAWAQALVKLTVQNVQTIYQGEGNLGQRMNHLDTHLRDAGHHELVFIGTDCPMLTQDYYHNLPSQLATTDVLLSKADDGGVVMMASNKAWPDLQHLPWSKKNLASALAQCCNQEELSVSYYDDNYDIDRIADLARLKDDLALDNRPARQVLLTHVINCFIEP
jgi:hypothetical protein